MHAIEGFEVTVANYEHALAAIIHRFGRKRIIVASLVKSIIKLEKKEKVNAASLCDLHDTLHNRMRALDSLGFTSACPNTCRLRKITSPCDNENLYVTTDQSDRLFCKAIYFGFLATTLE